MLTLPDLLAKFEAPRRVGKEWRTRCPAHDDTTPSLDISEGRNGSPVFRCRSHHCQTGDILSAVGLTWSDVLPDRESWDAVHEYRDRAGELSYRVYRRGTGKEKIIRQQGADGAWSLNGAARLPYRLPEISVASVVIVEGEKCADRLWAIGIQATCNVGGATNWRPTDTTALQAAGVTELIILPDEDEQGTAHASVVRRSALEHGLAARVVHLPGLPPKGDVVDWLEQGHTAAELYAALEPPPPPMLESIDDATVVIAEGQRIAQEGIRFVLDGIVPAYGMLGLLVAYAKVGKTTFGQAMAASVATGAPFIGRAVTQAKTLIIAAEDPPEYTAYLARHLQVPEGVLSFSRQPIQLDTEGLAKIVTTVQRGGYGFVLIASWQAVVSGLVKDENDNAGAVVVVERVKLAARATGVPWLIDAHSGKGEDQSDEADPTRAMRGASGAAGAADYLLSLRYADGTFATTRRLSGKGRFVNLEPLTVDYSPEDGYVLVGERKTALANSTWDLIRTTGALTHDWASASALAVAAGLAESAKDVTGGIRRNISTALRGRMGVERQEIDFRGRKAWHYRLSESTAHGDLGS